MISMPSLRSLWLVRFSFFTLISLMIWFGLVFHSGQAQQQPVGGNGRADLTVAPTAALAFSAPTNFGVGTNPRSVAVGDFNLDGKPDLAVVNQSSNNLSVLLGNGPGSFGTATNFTAGSLPFAVAVGDFNLDGKPDLATANFGSANVSVLLGNGAGSFGTATNFGVGSSPQSVAVGDFNLDGKPDLVTANGGNSVSVLLGNGAGSFGTATNFGVGGTSQFVAVGDFNLDGKPDLAVAILNSTNVSVLLGDGTGSFGTPTNFGVGINPTSVAVGDFNLDGKPDLAVANNTSGNVSVLLGNGAGSFGTATNFTVGTQPFSVAVGDFNLDGKPDLATANNGSTTVSVLLGNGAGSFGTATNFASGSNPASVAVGDFNLDGKPDLAVANFNSNNVSVLLNQTDQAPCTGIPFGTATNFGGITAPVSVAVGDFNLDGKPDLAAANSGSPNVSVLLGNGAGSFGTATNFAVGNSPRSVAVGDFNLDGKPDLAVAYSTGTVSVLLGDGTGSFGPATNFAIGADTYLVVVGDFNLDGKPDLATANFGSANISVLLGNGAGSFGATTNFAVGNGPRSVAVGDFNLDGKPDLATANFNSNNVSVLLGNGAGSFGTATNFGVGINPTSVAVRDFNLDGKPDMAVANGNSNNVSVFLGNGLGGFGAATNFGVGTRPISVAVGDFNLDGQPDLAVANTSSANVSVLLGNGSGSFGTATNFGVGTSPFSLAVGDFNLDGKSDLTTANLFSNNVSVLLYSCSSCSTITGTVSGTATICAGGNTTVTVTLTGGTPPYSVTLTNGGGTQTGSSPLTFTVAPGATTTYMMQSGTDANACSVTGSGSATVTVNSAPSITASSTPYLSGGSLTLTSLPTGGAGGYTFAWTGPNGFTSSLQNPPAINPATAVHSGTYTVTVTDANGCMGTATTVATIQSSAGATLTGVTAMNAPGTPPTNPADGSYGTVGISGTLTNTSGGTLFAPLYFQVTGLNTLPAGGSYWLDSRTNGASPIAVGATQIVLASGSLANNATQAVTFRIAAGPAFRQPFQFYVELYGAANASPQPRKLGQFAFTFQPRQSAVAAAERSSESAAMDVTELKLEPTASAPLIGGLGLQSNPVVAVDPAEPKRMAVAGTNYAQGVVSLAYTENGSTWRQTALPRTVGGVTYDGAHDPQVGYDGAGGLYVSYSLRNLLDNAHALVVVRKLLDRLTFNVPEVVTASPDSARVGLLHQSLAVSGSRVMLAWTTQTAAGNTIWVRELRSKTPAVAVAQGQVENPTLTIGTDGTVVVGWNDWGSNRLLCATSEDGQRFTSPVLIARSALGLGQSIPALTDVLVTPALSLKAVPGKAGGLVAAYADLAQTTDVWLTRSFDNGQTWEAPSRVNDQEAGDQFNPALAVDGQGNVSVSFQDTRLDASRETVNVYLARSADGGATFGANERLSEQASNTSRSNPNRIGIVNLGERTGLASRGKEGWIAVWTDTRMGSEDIFMSLPKQ